MTLRQVGSASFVLAGAAMMGLSLEFRVVDPQYAGVFALGGLMLLIGLVTYDREGGES